MKKLLGFAVYCVTILCVAGAFGLYWLGHKFAKPGPLTEETLIEIPRGSSLNSIGRILENEGAIKDAYVFILSTRIVRAGGDMKAGEYMIPAQASAKKIMNLIRRGDAYERRFTIPEGLTNFEIVRILNGIEELTGEVNNLPQEGRLLPNTYDYRLKEDRQAIIDRMHQAKMDVLEELWPKRADNLPFDTKEEALTLASIVEKETGVASERAKVAGVFINRLKQGMPLQSDPTVIYAITKGEHKNDGKGPLGRRLLRKDLEFDSPYNTYKNAGLTPGPIANVGKAAIEAVLNPEEHEFIYFVADGTGGHAFAKTLAEHNTNVAKWRKIRAAQ